MSVVVCEIFRRVVETAAPVGKTDKESGVWKEKPSVGVLLKRDVVG